MAGPFVIRSQPAPAIAPRGNIGPFEHDGNLWVVALVDTTYLSETLGLYKSADGGETWAQTGSTKSIGLTDTGYFAGFGACADADFPASPYLYVLYVDESKKMRVARFDVDAEDFDFLSDEGDEIPLGIVPVLLIEHSTDGVLGLLVNYRSDPTFGEARVDAYSIADTLGAFTGPTEIDGQSDGQIYVAVGIAKGSGGRVHGFIHTGTDSPSGTGEIYHTLVLEAGGGIGGGSDFIAESNYDGFVSTAFAGGDIAIAYPAPGWAVPIDATGLLDVLVSVATSADIPSWTETTAYSGAITGLAAYWNGGNFEAFYSPDGSGDILRSVFDSLAWGNEQTLAPGPLFVPSVRAITDGVGIVYFDFDFEDLFFLSALALDPEGLILTGETIPTGEEFFATHGVSGGGNPQNCGPVTIEPPEPGCNSNPGGPVDPGERNTCNVGAGFSF